MNEENIFDHIDALFEPLDEPFSSDDIELWSDIEGIPRGERKNVYVVRVRQGIEEPDGEERKEIDILNAILKVSGLRYSIAPVEYRLAYQGKKICSRLAVEVTIGSDCSGIKETQEYAIL